MSHLGPVLIVDDDIFIASSLRMLLKARNISSCIVTDMQSALNLCRIENFGLIVTEMTMPIMNGLTFSALARSIQPGIGVVLTSAFGTHAAIAEALKTKLILQYVSKPWVNEEIIEIVIDELTRVDRQHRLDCKTSG